MAPWKILACASLISFAIAASPAVAQNGNDPPAANPSTSPAPVKQPRKHHSGKHRRQQKPASQQQGAPANRG